jgi:hypothetical protein
MKEMRIVGLLALLGLVGACHQTFSAPPPDLYKPPYDFSVDEPRAGKPDGGKADLAAPVPDDLAPTPSDLTTTSSDHDAN